MRVPAQPRRVRLLGGEVDLVTPRDVLRTIDGAAARPGVTLIANHNAHSLFLIRRSAQLKAFFAAAELIQIDSVPLIGWGRLMGLPLRRTMRSTYLDWRTDFWKLAEARRWRVFYLGGAPGVADEAARRLGQLHPRATLCVSHGYFDHAADSADNRAVIAEIRAFDPDVLMVGMGMPLQEIWALEHRAALKRGVILTVGAAFDYEAGAQKTPPRWAGRLGVEWLARLVDQPGRLGRRYLVEPWWLVGPALVDVGAALGRRAMLARGGALAEDSAR
ncbi:MAG TPA: WecB/TagA/CpsF family glycosyltransferase [Caulobacteraceae bacterium]|jgi:N-acetylglucosaminyldiphosphoundecaprenol N-acetyl-beta-D-mannosaminyltransferase